MQIEKLKIEQLIPSDYNPRKDLKPGDPEYDKLKRSIEQFGYVEPVIWNIRVSTVICMASPRPSPAMPLFGTL